MKPNSQNPENLQPSTEEREIAFDCKFFLNTAILSRSGGNQGVGFAVPVDMVRQVMTQLKDKGTVTRARLGLYFQELTPKLASALGAKSLHY